MIKTLNRKQIYVLYIEAQTFLVDISESNINEQSDLSGVRIYRILIRWTI